MSDNTPTPDPQTPPNRPKAEARQAYGMEWVFVYSPHSP